MAIIVTTLCERANNHGGHRHPMAALWPLYLVKVDQMVAKGVRAMYPASTRKSSDIELTIYWLMGPY
jgi:hypothetical protein